MPKNRIDETLKRILAGTSPAKSKISLTPGVDSGMPGDPACPLCNGQGYLRQDVPMGHPEFGKVTVCDCRRQSVTDQVRSRLYAFSRLDELKDLTFETFKPQGRNLPGELKVRSLEYAYSHCQQYASSLQGWILLMGGFGCGKTHLAAAIANYVVQLGVPALFLTVPDLLDSLRFSYDSVDTTFEARFEEIRNAGLLVLDDFGTQNATGWAQEKLFQIINYRYINKLPLVITTNLELEEIEPRIRSRLQDPELVTHCKILSPDFRRPMEDQGHSELSSLGLHARRTFASFLDRADESLNLEDLQTLEGALKEALAFAKNPQGWLVFTGTYGSGKTHLAAAIANERSGQGAPPLFIMVPDLLDHLRAAFNPSAGVSYDRRFDEVRTAPLLVLDDLGSQSATPWAKEKLYQLLNYRYNAELPTVITIAVDMLKDMDERIRTRIRDERICHIVPIAVPAFVGAKKKTMPAARKRRSI